MVLVPICCPHCGQDQVVKRGKTEQGKQREVGLIDLLGFKAVSIYEQVYYGIVKFFRLRKADCFSRQALDPCAQREESILYFLRVLLANDMFFLRDQDGIAAPIVGAIGADVKNPQVRQQLLANFVLAPPENE